MMTHIRAAVNEDQDQLRLTLEKLQKSRKRCEQLLQEIDDSEAEDQKIVKQNTELKLQLVDYSNQISNLQEEKEKLQEAVNSFHHCMDTSYIWYNLAYYGSVVSSSPLHVMVMDWFWGFINFFYLLFQTLINPNFNKHGDKYTRDFRPPGGGPPKPPTRKFGGFGPSGSGPSPPPAGGCGCGG